MKSHNYNPDVLTCLANLSNDEVFTPPAVVNEMLDLLPSELWSNPDARFLDPVSKSGVFLREIAKRLLVGLEGEIPDLQQRIDHILHRQLFGIAITELTSLLSRRSVYCSKTANGHYSVSDFGTETGNIIFDRTEHLWRNGKCSYCGASEAVYDRGDEMENHAYQFIHTDKPEEIFKNMKFDVIIGNPPYQLNDGGGIGTSAMPIYHKFVLQAIKMNPRYLTMIIPSRWFSGGKGLDEFRNSMLKDNQLCEIHDFIEAADCFPGVQIKGGVNYFLWKKGHTEGCKVTTHKGGKEGITVVRPLLEKNSDVFIRFNEAISILRKVSAFKEKSLSECTSSRKPFGLESDFQDFSATPKPGLLPLYRYGETGFVNPSHIIKGIELIPKFKVFISKAGSGSDSFPHQILGIPIIGKPDTVCTETYIILGVFDNISNANNLISYVTTKFFRFMVFLMKNTQNASKKVYSFVPIQDFNESWTDEKLYAKYGLTEDEIAFIDSMIRPMEL